MAVDIHPLAINPGPMGEFMRWSATQRAHVCVFGNSNAFFNTASAGGLMQALHIEAALAGIPIYATPLMTICGIDGTTGAPSRSNGWITQAYPEFSRFSLGDTAGNYFDPAPNGGTGLVRDPQDPLQTNWTGLGMAQRWGRADVASSNFSTVLGLLCMTGTTSSTPLVFANNGIQSVTVGAPANPNYLDWREAFRGHIYLANTTVGGGTARPGITINNVLTAQTPAVTVAAGTPTWRNIQRYRTDTIAAGTRAGAVRFGLTVPNGTAITGNVAASYLFLEMVNRTFGWQFSCPWAIGGASMLDIAHSLYNSVRATPDETIYHLMEAACQTQADLDQDPAFTLAIQDTLNARVETNTTAFNQVAVANSVDAYVAHVSYVIGRMQSVWNSLRLVGSNGTTPVVTKANRFKVLLALDHPSGVPDDPLMISYREEAGRILAAKFPDTVTVLRMDRVINAEELHAVNSEQGYASNITATITAIGTGATPLVTTSGAHGLSIGRFVNPAGTNSTPNINGRRRVLSVPTTTTFTIDGPVVTGAGTTGTVVIRDPAHLTEGGYRFAAGKIMAALRTLPPTRATGGVLVRPGRGR